MTKWALISGWLIGAVHALGEEEFSKVLLRPVNRHAAEETLGQLVVLPALNQEADLNAVSSLRWRTRLLREGGSTCIAICPNLLERKWMLCLARLANLCTCTFISM